MTTTATSTATNWRELADQLTPKQIADLEHWEVTSTHPNRGEAILRAAQEHAQGNAWARQYADVPLPPDAGSVSHWDRVSESEIARHFWGTDRDGVFICGYQKPDGTIYGRYIALDFNPGDMGSSVARDLGRRLIAAADELDEVNAALA